ncbi:MAG: hypothetical protein P4L99_22580 [Chthoniobacter sp.]|nr:hypothetical protein [Chthoniobacter sp.]
MKARMIFTVGLIASTGLLLAPFCRADNLHYQYTERREIHPRHHAYYQRPYPLGFTPSQYYHEHPIVMSDDPYIRDREYMGPTIGFTFAFGGEPHQRAHQYRH